MSSYSSVSLSSTPKSTKIIEPSSEERVSERLMDFVSAAFEYYSHNAKVNSGSEALDKVVGYLDVITDSLRNRHQNWSPKLAFTASPSSALATTNPVHASHSTKKKEDDSKLVAAPTMALASIKQEQQSPLDNPNTLVTSSSGTGEDCRICLDAIGNRRVGILECCDHIYCEACIRAWIHEKGPNKLVKCPTCRALSSRVIFRARPLTPGAEKDAAFDSMICCGPHVPATGEDSEDEDDDLFLYFTRDELAMARDELTFERELLNEMAGRTLSEVDDDDIINDPDFSVSTQDTSELISLCTSSSSSSSMDGGPHSVATITVYESDLDGTTFETIGHTDENSFSDSIDASTLDTMPFTDDEDEDAFGA